MPLDVRGRTRATLNGSACVRPSPAGVGNPLKPIRDRDWGLELFPMNEEFPVSASHKLALIKSLPFVHTARRYYRLDGLVRSSDWPRWGRRLPWGCAEKTIELDCLEEVKVPIERGSGPDPRTLRAETDATPRGGRPGALEWVRPEIGACALQSAAAPAASGLQGEQPLACWSNVGKGSRQAGSITSGQGLALRAGSVGLGREAGSGRALRLGEAPAVVSGGWGTSLDVCRALPAERLSCGGSLAAAVRPRCPSPGCQDPVRCRAGASPRPASSSRLRTGADQGNPTV
ncbi:unnamed protein product [Lampetra planeri]